MPISKLPASPWRGHTSYDAETRSQVVVAATHKLRSNCTVIPDTGEGKRPIALCIAEAEAVLRLAEKYHTAWGVIGFPSPRLPDDLRDALDAFVAARNAVAGVPT